MAQGGPGRPRGEGVCAEVCRVAAELARLHEQAMAGLRRLLEVHERLRTAARIGSADHVRQLAGLEAAATAAVVAAEKSILTIEGSARLGSEGAAHAEVRSVRAEHEALRARALDSGRLTGEVLRREILATRRELAGRRTRMGIPSPFATAGDAALVDVRI